MLVDAVVASIALGKLRGGRLRGLADLQLRRIDFAVVAFLIEGVITALGLKGAEAVIKLAPYLYFLSYMLLFFVILSNRDLPEMLIIGIGIFLNFLVIFLNGGKMPVSPGALRAASMEGQIPLLESGRAVTYAILSEETSLKFLADIIPISNPYPFHRVISPGDVVIAVGAFILIQRAMTGRGRPVATRRKAVP